MDEITINRGYYQEQDMAIRFSVNNQGGMQDNEFFEIVGSDFAYTPVEGGLPSTIPTVVPNELYPQLMPLLLGMFAAVSVRNHLHKASRSLPLDLLAVACGIAMPAPVRLWSRGMVHLLASVLSKDSHLQDLAGVLLVFANAGYIVMQVLEWSFVVVVGTLTLVLHCA